MNVYTIFGHSATKTRRDDIPAKSRADAISTFCRVYPISPDDCKIVSVSIGRRRLTTDAWIDRALNDPAWFK